MSTSASSDDAFFSGYFWFGTGTLEDLAVAKIQLYPSMTT
jgi:hypothetical protein